MAKDDNTIPPANFLTAMIENQSQNAVEQFKLGRFYFEKNDLKSAIEHLSLAVEMEPQNTEYWANLGAFYLKAGKEDFAEKCFEKTLAENSNESYRLYFQTLEKYSFAEKAREKMLPKIVEVLGKSDVDNSQEMQELIRKIALSFTDENAKSAYFKKLLRQRPTDKSLVKMLLDENLLTKNSQNAFYEILISRSEKFNNYDSDYDFKSTNERVWSQADAESVYEQENNFQIEEPRNERIEWQRKYLELLLEQRDNAKAERIVAEIEAELNGKFARPSWLRAAKINLQIRGGKIDFSEIERFIGISVSDAATEIISPNVERFNTVLQILKTEKRESEMLRLKESFFARMLALEQFEIANFAGFARVLFEKGETEKALQVLRLMTSESRETSLAEISEFAEIKSKSADSAKMQDGSNSFPSQSVSLKTAAEIAFEFKQNEPGIGFRRKLIEINANDFENKLKLAEIFLASDKKAESFEILRNIIADRNAFRAMRWQARKILIEAGEKIEIPNEKFDSFSQFYNGLFAEKLNQQTFATEFFLNSLIADNETQIASKQELIEMYAANGNENLALKIAENDKSAKSDELLQILSEAAERIENFQKATEFENAKSLPNTERIADLQKLAQAKNQKATDFTVNAENTRKL